MGRAQRGRRPRRAPRRLRRDQDHEARAGAHGRLGGRAREQHVSIEPSGWGTKVTCTPSCPKKRRRSPSMAWAEIAEPVAKETVPAEPVTEEWVAEVPVAEVPTPERRGFWGWLLRTRTGVGGVPRADQPLSRSRSPSPSRSSRSRSPRSLSPKSLSAEEPVAPEPVAEADRIDEESEETVDCQACSRHSRRGARCSRGAHHRPFSRG